MTAEAADRIARDEAVAGSGMAGQIKRHIPFGYAGLMLGIFFLLPFAFMVVISFSENISSGLWIYGFELTHYERFFSPLFITHLWVSVKFGLLT